MTDLSNYRGRQKKNRYIWWIAVVLKITLLLLAVIKRFLDLSRP